jgi:hypothetical protein
MLHILFLATFASAFCRNSTFINTPADTSVISTTLPFCKAHEFRTCCDSRAALAIYSKLTGLYTNSPFFEDYTEFSPRCKEITANVFCSYCDGDV